MRRLINLGLSAGILLMVASVDYFRTRADQTTSAPYNILLVTPDQMGADYMHTYRYGLPDTPNIDQLASEGTTFLRAYSAGPWTVPSFGSILTGLFPTVHGMTLPPLQGCGPDIDRPMVAGSLPPVPAYLRLSRPILPELLKSHDFSTALDVSNCFAIWNVLHKGWDDFKFFAGAQLPQEGHQADSWHDPFYLTAPKTLGWAQQYLTSHRDQRFFLWVHFMEPHAPYNAPPKYDQFKTADDFPDVHDDNAKEGDHLHDLAKLGDVHAINRLKQLYAAKIMYVDRYVGLLMRIVRDLGLDKNTIVVLVSDHGQLLYSHPRDFNMDDHRSVYDADLHIPLIFRGPGIPEGKRVDAMVSQYDLVPTLLDLEDFPVPPNLDGESLKPIFSGKSSAVHQYLFGEETVFEPQYSVRDSRYKLIESLRSGSIECFDNDRDPLEQRDICADIPEKAAELKAALDKHIQAMVRKAKSFPDWENNLALAVLEQRDSKALRTLAPGDATVHPMEDSHFQIERRGWSLSADSDNCSGPCVWAMPGPGTVTAVWRVDALLMGEYEISVWYGKPVALGRTLATNANFTVQFKGGSLSFSVDQNRNQGQWNVLGRFTDPISVELTNLAEGPVVAGAVRFVRLGPQETASPENQIRESHPR